MQSLTLSYITCIENVDGLFYIFFIFSKLRNINKFFINSISKKTVRNVWISFIKTRFKSF